MTKDQFIAKMQPRIGGEPVGGRITSDLCDELCADLNAARDEATAESPLVVPGVGSFDFDALSREKLNTASQAVPALDIVYPLSAPNSVVWTLSDNTTKAMTAADFRSYFLTVAQRAQTIHDACARCKVALKAGQEPDAADLAIVFPN